MKIRRSSAKMSLNIAVIRPPDTVVGGLSFYRNSIFFFFFFFFPSLPSELAERNSTKTGSECDLKMYVRHLGCSGRVYQGYTFPLQFWSPKTTYFRRLGNLSSTLTAYIFGTKHDIQYIIRQVRWIVHCVSKSFHL